MSRRPDDAPPLSPAAQAVLDKAQVKPWQNHGQHAIGYWDADHMAHVAIVGGDIRDAAVHAVNAYARDRERLAMAREGLKRIDRVLRVPAAEYVPAIGDAFTVIDELLVALGTEA